MNSHHRCPRPHATLAAAALAIAAILSPAGAAFASPMGQAAANEVTVAAYRDTLDSWLYTRTGHSRGLTGAQHDPARQNIQSRLMGFGLTVTIEPFTYSGNTYYNVVGTQHGTIYPNREFIIGAHYDSVNNPGADDNASGVALVLEAARVLSQYPSDYTIRYIAFDCEEVGLVGSSAYVATHSGADIVGMISTDMVAYNTGANSADIHADAGGAALQANVANAVALYGQGLGAALLGPSGGSDHAPFAAAGHPACLFIEDWGNPNYHTQLDCVDTPNYIDYDYAARMTRSIVGYLVDNAGVLVNVDTLIFNFPNGQPTFVSPFGETSMAVTVAGLGNAVPQPGTGTLHVDDGGGWQAVPMSTVSANDYEALFPPTTCGARVLYYVSALDTNGATFTDPWDAPNAVYEATAGFGFDPVFTDNFETDRGWTVENLGATTGDWDRGIPVNDPNWAYDPISDSDGSGKCFVTDNRIGNTDVDGGAVRLTSPTLDMSESPAAVAYDYFLRLTNTNGGVDRLLVEINNNDGVGAWTPIATHIANGGLDWHHHRIDEGQISAAGVTLTPLMRLRFTANDANPQSIVEGGLDAFETLKLSCCPGPDGDLDGSGRADGLDLQPFIDALLGTPGARELCHADFSGDGALDPADIPGMVAAVLSQ